MNNSIDITRSFADPVYEAEPPLDSDGVVIVLGCLIMWAAAALYWCLAL